MTKRVATYTLEGPSYGRNRLHNFAMCGSVLADISVIDSALFLQLVRFWQLLRLLGEFAKFLAA